MNKITIPDYHFTPEDARAYFTFLQWIRANPNGGYFKYGEVELNVWVQQSVFNQQPSTFQMLKDVKITNK
jgi:hypothetical protein